MSDKARKKTEKELIKIERQMNYIYSEAYDDISKSWNKFMETHAPMLEKAQKELEEAKKSGDAQAIAEARDRYERIARNIMINDQRYRAMRDETAAKLSHTNEVALAYINDQMPKIYTINYNEFGENEIDGYSFSLVNENAVRELATVDTTLLPTKKVDVPKDMRWNEKNINSQMLQGILQGESIPKIAKRLINVTDMNRKSAIRNARTMTTAAENKGRQDSFKKAQDDGVIMEREWVAAHDDHTRAWHLDLDGVRVDVDEPWENEYGEIMYPGDPSADPANVYNCRCSIRAHIKGFKWNEEEEEINEEELPETLKDYEEAYQEFREKRASQIEDMQPFEDMNKLLTDLVDNNEFRMRIPADDATVLRSILTDGKFKTQFETSTSGGAFAPERRKIASHNLFNTPDDIPNSGYEKYGYLGSKDLEKDNSPTLYPYGDGIITFKKDIISDRTTLTVGDSLRNALDGRYIMGTKVNEIDSTVGIGRPSMAKAYLDQMSKYVDEYGIDDASHASFGVGYLELQYHGDLTLNDVDTMTIDKFILDEVFADESLRKKAKEAGIKFNYIVNGNIIDYDLD